MTRPHHQNTAGGMQHPAEGTASVLRNHEQKGGERTALRSMGKGVFQTKTELHAQK